MDMKRVCLSFVMVLLVACLSVGAPMAGDSCSLYITDIQAVSDGKAVYTNLPPGTYLLEVGTEQEAAGRKAVLQKVSQPSSGSASWGWLAVLFLLCGVLWWMRKRQARKEPQPTEQPAVPPCPEPEEPSSEVQTDAVEVEEPPVPSVDDGEPPSEVPQEQPPSEIPLTSMEQKLMERAVKYIENNISRSDLSVEELSYALGMSRVNLYKRLLAISGKTPIEFIRSIRLKRAAQLLRESRQNVSEIAYQVGFNNPKYFSKYFREEFGVLPSVYQNTP